MEDTIVRYLAVLMSVMVGLGVAVVAAQEGGDTEPRRYPKVRQVRSGQQRFTTLEQTKVLLSGTGSVMLLGAEPIRDSLIEVRSEDAWVYFAQVKPSVVVEKYLGLIEVKGVAAEHGMNVRVAQYKDGAVVIPHGPDYAALAVYGRSGYAGAQQSMVVHDYYREDELGQMNDRVSSFKLKKGYMATFAENADGTGASRVYIAHREDVSVPRMPRELAGKVSFVRVFPWRWVNKKGFAGKLESTEKLDGAWRYDWGAGSRSTLDVEFVPMRHNKHWDSYEKINAKENVTHVLGFNEPNAKDQANMTVRECLAQWPRLQASGLRIGSPSPTDGGLQYLYEFMDEADKRGYRVDFVAVHFYRGHYTPQRLVKWLEAIHKRTGRPIWVTEFNNGADWVKNHNPSLKENAAAMDGFIRALDAAPFVERYSVFNLGNAKFNRQVIRDGKLTPAGVRYRDHRSAEAYRGKLRSSRVP